MAGPEKMEMKVGHLNLDRLLSIHRIQLANRWKMKKTFPLKSLDDWNTRNGPQICGPFLYPKI